LGRFEEALAAIEVGESSLDDCRDPQPGDRAAAGAVHGLVLLRIGRSEAAKAKLDEVRALMASEPGELRPDAQRLLEEAESMMTH
jgi:hypothetical protein